MPSIVPAGYYKERIDVPVPKPDHKPKGPVMPGQGKVYSWSHKAMTRWGMKRRYDGNRTGRKKRFLWLVATEKEWPTSWHFRG